MLERAVVSAVTETTKWRTLQVDVRYDETRDDVEHVEPYGFTSRPKLSDSSGAAEAVCAKLGGDGAHTVALVVGDRRYRLTDLGAGEVALYDHDGQIVKLTSSGNIVISATSVIELGNGGTLVAANGAVTGLGIDPFTGQTYHALGNTSGKVRVEV